MHTIYFNKKKHPIPEKWEDLSAKQFTQVAGVIFSRLNPTAAKMQMLLILLNARRNWLLRIRLWRLRDEKHKASWYDALLDRLFGVLYLEDVAFLLHYTKFLFQPLQLTKQLLPFFEFKGVKYYGPGDKLEHLAFWEWVKADTYYGNYFDTRKVRWIDELVAVLYRPARDEFNPLDPEGSGDIREVYADHVKDKRVEVVAKWPLEVKLAILLFFQGSREQIIRRRKKIFKPGKGGESKVNAQSVWLQVLRKMSKGPLEFDAVAKLPYDTVLFELEQRIDEAEELKSKTK